MRRRRMVPDDGAPMSADDPDTAVRARNTSSRARARASWRKIFAWHQRVGLAAAVLVAILAVTGVLLNHTERLGLDERHATQGWLLDWYGVAPSRDPLAYRVDGHWLIWLDGRLLFDAAPIAHDLAAPVGAVALDSLLVVATPLELVLLTSDGALVERMAGSGLPGQIDAVGRSESGRLVVTTNVGAFAADEALLSWAPAAHVPDASEPEPLPDTAMEEALAAYRGEGLPWERVILDLHSGRIFGPWGPWLMDAAAIGLLFLSGTGFLNWLRLRRRRHR
ncbi:MAG: hypothetical protein CMM50_00965 [Rhodospirillaceae bacterium]|nr:hypothetical protein [Rhodospirillaceae bacterium]